MARPAAKIDWAFVDEYLEAGCEGVEIAGLLGVHPETLYNHCESDHKMGFSLYRQSKRAKGDAILRHKQYEIAKEGDKAMLIWLGKNRLGQSEKQEVTVSSVEVNFLDDSDTSESA
jgi:hypothetical protein